MEEYLQQLLNDIAGVTEHIGLPFEEKHLQLNDWISDEEEESTAPVRQLEEWTGINQAALPPSYLLSDILLNETSIAGGDFHQAISS